MALLFMKKVYDSRKGYQLEVTKAWTRIVCSTSPKGFPVVLSFNICLANLRHEIPSNANFALTVSVNRLWNTDSLSIQSRIWFHYCSRRESKISPSPSSFSRSGPFRRSFPMRGENINFEFCGLCLRSQLKLIGLLGFSPRSRRRRLRMRDFK